MSEKESNSKNILKSSFENFGKKYRNVKDSIDDKTGKIVFHIFNTLMIIVILVVMPILFTVMTTLLVSAGGPISALAYKITFYLVWLLFIILFLIRTFFKEYK